MPTVIASGVSDVTAGYTGILYGLSPSKVYFLDVTIEGPSMQYPVYYGDFIQLVADLPYVGSAFQIQHQAIWLDKTELNIRRDFGTFVTFPSFRWKFTGLDWSLIES